MGLLAECAVEYNGQRSFGKAHLDSDMVTFSGDFRLAIPFAEISNMAAKRGELQLDFPAGMAQFELGSAAEKWLLKIRYPRKLIDKLGVREDSKVTVLGVEDADFFSHLKARTQNVNEGRLRKNCDFIFFGVGELRDLDSLQRIVDYIQRNGAIWVVWRKGRKELNRDHVMAASKKAGLVDIKIASFSDTHSALKMVIPVADR